MDMSKMPVVYECRCPVVVINAVWWRVEPRCPEHDKPIRPAELEPIAEHSDETFDFWVA